MSPRINLTNKHAKKLSMSSHREFSMVQNNPLLSSAGSIEMPAAVSPSPYNTNATTNERDARLLHNVAASNELEIVESEGNRH